jgi:tetratricopeptide (TPR) repeat protein
MTHRPNCCPSRAVSHEVAAASQTAYPTSFAAALHEVDSELSFDLRRATPPGGGWLAHAMVGNSYLKRARLTGSFDDYASAGAAYDRAFAVADPGFGPHLERASYNLTVHRLDRVEPDLARIDRYAVPVDAATRSSILGMRGDLLFYRGRYGEALALYEQSRALAKACPAAFVSPTTGRKWAIPILRLRYIGEAETGSTAISSRSWPFSKRSAASSK